MPENSHGNIEFERLRLERERFKFERQGIIFRYIAVLGATITFAWGAFQYLDGARLQRQKMLNEEKAATAVQKLAASQPFLQRQLQLFEEATQTAAYLATVSLDAPDRQKKLLRFEQLFWGELALVENKKVEQAMITFRAVLVTNAQSAELKNRSLKIAHACREELANSWNISHWRYGSTQDSAVEGSDY